MSTLFHDQALHIKKVLIFILRCFQSYLNPEDLEKSHLHVSNNFQIGTVTINPSTEIW